MSNLPPLKYRLYRAWRMVLDRSDITLEFRLQIIYRIITKG